MTAIKVTMILPLLILGLFLPAITAAQEQSSYVLIEDITKNLFRKIANLSDQQRNDKSVMRTLV